MQAITWPALVGVCRMRPRASETFSGSLKKRIQSILWTHNVSKLSVWGFNASGSRSCSGLVLLHPPCAGGTGGLRFWDLCVALFQNTTERLQNKSLEDSNLSQARTLCEWGVLWLLVKPEVLGIPGSMLHLSKVWRSQAVLLELLQGRYEYCWAALTLKTILLVPLNQHIKIYWKHAKRAR